MHSVSCEVCKIGDQHGGGLSIDCVVQPICSMEKSGKRIRRRKAQGTEIIWFTCFSPSTSQANHPRVCTTLKCQMRYHIITPGRLLCQHLNQLREYQLLGQCCSKPPGRGNTSSAPGKVPMCWCCSPCGAVSCGTGPTLGQERLDSEVHFELMRWQPMSAGAGCSVRSSIVVGFLSDLENQKNLSPGSMRKLKFAKRPVFF